ncbi:DUF1697 domain-containing protein [Listeria monocytogenes]|uniref:DUF1697 domain-containing protein n=1 Tax=Listeria monocytogenes TaxID=1639 RepID=A0AB37NVP0_LISMN|nr:DUF1697 domain-containing protein [Listeria monocytogenes]EAA0165986.1 DUF1697 domain-containing protein [Listeria monocytogenes serotype 1/2a]EAF4520051.1 DUF1697 domain-containing protein [Listeria monocytogenes serotype 4b]AKI49775.1 hypothetical protein L2625_01920 [Listeria monocytogenes]ARJ89520.1 hypothetical protein Y281_07015 [Listeria monocytogenes]EAC2274127.1 DUF1697 domain-containing protein [Listeria monocytogenes]
MRNYVALLRAVNVAGKNKVNMKNLKGVLEEEGFQNVVTYIQSGNLVLSSILQTETEVAAKITKVIKAICELTIDVFVFSEQNYKQIIANNPFPPETIGEEERWMAAFYNENIDIPRQKNDQAEVIAIGRVLYVHVFSNQIHTLKLPVFLGQYKMALTTTRNWRTTLQLKTLLDSQE